MEGKKIFQILLFVAVFIIYGNARLLAQSPDGQVPLACPNSNTSFSGGELLRYKIYYNWKFIWVPAGEVSFGITEDSTHYHFTVIGKTYKSYNSFFRVNDYYHSSVLKETMKPSAFVRYVEEGKYRKFDSLTFDHQNQKLYSLNGKTKAKAKSKTFDIDSCALDLISVMYTLRNTDVESYQEGDYLDVSMFLDEEIFPIRIGYVSREVKGIRKMGKYPTVKVNPQLVVGNVFKEGDVMNIWVSDDANKVPLLIESPVSVGSVKAVLMSYKGLRHKGVLQNEPNG